MIISNTQEVPGKTIVEFFGLVSGSTVRAKHIGRDIAASLKNIVGGELHSYTELLQESRSEALDRMEAQRFNVFGHRVGLSKATKIALMARLWARSFVPSP